jgi:hypothetical protein
MLNDETKWKIELLIKRCSAVCEVGKMLQQLWNEYRAQDIEIEDLKKQLRNTRGEGR